MIRFLIFVLGFDLIAAGFPQIRSAQGGLPSLSEDLFGFLERPSGIVFSLPTDPPIDAKDPANLPVG